MSSSPSSLRSHQRGLLLDVLVDDLSAALRLERAQLHAVEARRHASFAVVDLLPPRAFAAAARLDTLLRVHAAAAADVGGGNKPRVSSPLAGGRAARAINGSAGLMLIRADGTSERFAPPPEALRVADHAEAAVLWVEGAAGAPREAIVAVVGGGRSSAVGAGAGGGGDGAAVRAAARTSAPHFATARPTTTTRRMEAAAVWTDVAARAGWGRRPDDGRARLEAGVGLALADRGSDGVEV